MRSEGALGRVSLRMTSTLDLHEVLDEIAQGLVSELDAALARIWLLEADEHLRLAASAGLSTRLDGAYARVAVGAKKIGQIALTREPVCTNAPISDERIAEKAWVEANGIASFAGYPLLFGGRLVGVLAMFARAPLEQAQLDRLEIFAAHAAVAIENARLFAQVSALSRRLEDENAYLKEELRAQAPAGIVGASAALDRVLREIERVAPTHSTVLLLGETGTGKELFARRIHELSPRRDRALVKVSCAAIAPTLIESELFGHERGAFTGAVHKRIGRFELASGGTLFLDEIGELPIEVQAKLLRVIQEREIERIGSTHPIAIDVRLVCATNRDLSGDVKSGRFRADLYYRLNVFPIEIPPLRQRRGDVPLLANAFLRELGERLGRRFAGFDEAALEVLSAYDWPGNVRELHNTIERAAILARGARITVADLPELGGPPAEAAEDGSLRDRVAAYERSIIAEALSRAQGNQSEAARILRTSRATLLYKMKSHGLA